QTFAREQLAEFCLFWQDNRQLHSSWNTKFLQHVKYRWARQHQFEANSGPGGLHAQQQATDRHRAGKAQAGSTFDRLTDRSWASSL
ncbi:MAG: DnaT-like ssDNA-binding domain-containing protein, partial [Pseudomonadales bacterium]